MTRETADRIIASMRAGYEATAEERGRARFKPYWGELKRFMDYVREGEAVLDVGCGTGHAYELFREKKVAYAGVDLSQHMVESARGRWKGTDAVFEAGDLLALPVPDGRYDAVVAVAVLHHVPSEAYRLRAMGELARATRKGGYVFIVSWNLWQPRYWHVLLHQRFGLRNGWDFGDLKVTWKKPFFPRYYHVFTRNEMRGLCERSGLDIVEQYYVRRGEVASWLRGETLVTIARRR